MTAYDAFAIAFDEIADEEVVAMDKKPQTMIHQKRNKKFGASGSDALPSAGGSLPKNGDSSQSLAQHMQQYHPDGFDPHKNKCKFFDALQKNFEQQGLSKEEAEKKALEAHSGSGYGGATGEAVAEEEGRQLADQLFQQLKAKPSAFAIEGLARQARLIQPPMEIEGGEDGEKIQIQDTFQLACMMFLQDQKESGNEVVENAAEKAENRIVETLGGEGDKTEQTTEQSQLGGYEQILKEHPERKELYDKMNELLAKQKEIAAREATTEEESNKNQKEYNNINAELASVGAKLREGYERQFEGYEEGDSRKVETEGQTVEPVSQKLTSTDGAYSRDLTVAETATLQAYPERKEQLQRIVDLEARLQGSSEEEQADLQNQIEALKIQFLGKEETGSPTEGSESGDAPKTKREIYEEADKAYKEAVARYDAANAKFRTAKAGEELQTAIKELKEASGAMIDAQSAVTQAYSEMRTEEAQKETPEEAPAESPEPAEGGGDTTAESSAPEESRSERTEPPRPAETPAEPSRESISEPASQEREPAPADEEFMTKNGKYKLGDVTYTDVSQHGLLGGMVAAFLAGLRGEGIITGWDRISGTWDEMKRSANGENVRDGIKGALTNLGIDGYMDKVTDPVARGKLETIKEMFQKAKTPAQKMAAYNAFEKWREQYMGESGGVASGGGNFSEEMQQRMDSVHSNGGVTASNVVIGKDGKPITTTVPKDHKLPTADVLGNAKFNAKASIENIEEKQENLKKYLEGQLGIAADDMTVTPSFNQTFIGVKVENAAQGKAIEKHIDDIVGALGEKATAVFDPKSKTVMIALENQVKGDVTAKEIFASKEWEEAKKTMACPIIIGKDMQGKPVIADMKKLVHLLVAGQTGKGKSVAMNTILTSIMMGAHPDDVKMVLIDPKGVEFGAYANAPHNLLPIAQTPEDSLAHIKWLENEVTNRKKFLNEANKKFGQNFKDIDDYNAWAKENGQKTLPRIVCAIDELTELTAKAGPEFEERLKSLGNIARFTGINLIVATQHPTKKNIGGLKDNLPSRLAFSATNREATQAILGHGDEVDPDTGERRLGTGSIHRSGEFLFETETGGQIHGQGANTGEEDVARLNEFWGAGQNTPSDEEQLKALEEELSGIHPEMTDSAQAKEAEERKASDIQRKINQLKEKMAKASGGGKTLPQEHQDAIKAAVEKEQPISMEAEEGFMDAFKGSFPEGWTVTEETVDGKKHWKASPPKKEEANPTESREAIGGGESTKPTKLDFSSPQALADSIETIRKEEIAKAKETFANSEQTDADESKLAKSISKANDRAAKRRSDFASEMEGASIEEGDETLSDEADTVKEESAEPEESDEDSPATLMKDAKAQLEAEKQRIDKKLANPSLKLRERRKLRQERDALQKLFNEAKAKFEANGTADEILDILEPEGKPEGSKEGSETTNSGNPTAEEESPQLTEEEQKAAAEQEQAKKNEQLRKTVKPQEAYGESTLWGKREATERLTPKEIKTISEKFMPPGWEFVTENGFNAPARDRFGLIFVRDPATGSHGRLIPSKDNPGTYKLQKDVDTTHPEYKGMVQKEDGSWGLSPEAAKVEAETRADRKQTKDPKKRKEALTRYHRAVFGHDEAPDNMTIVANAVAEALAKINQP